AASVKRWDPQLDRMYPWLSRFASRTNWADNYSEEEVKRGTFQAIAHLIMAESEKAPVVMLIEDLHWMDEPSREMLQAAVAEMHDASFMLLVSHRPDYRPSWRTQAAFTQITLRKLPDEHITRIIRTLAGAPLPADLESLIREKAE